MTLPIGGREVPALSVLDESGKAPPRRTRLRMFPWKTAMFLTVKRAGGGCLLAAAGPANYVSVNTLGGVRGCQMSMKPHQQRAFRLEYSHSGSRPGGAAAQNLRPIVSLWSIKRHGFSRPVILQSRAVQPDQVTKP